MENLSFIEPMKASSAPPPPDNGEWIYEVKFDGYRGLAVRTGTDLDLWSRSGNSLNKQFPELVSALSTLSLKRFILDGEICALDDQGKSSFQLLQNQGETNHPVVFYVFDVLVYGSKDLRKLPLIERKMQLETILSSAAKPILRSPYFDENPQLILNQMRTVGVEGAIAKLKTSTYETGHRSNAWVKIKFQMAQEFVIVGYTLPKKSRQYFGSLILGYYRDKRLIFAGKVGTGFNEKTLRSIYEKMKPLEISQPACEEITEPSGRWRPKGWKASDSRWLKPELVAQVQFAEWTDDGILRQPSFLGLRDDKKASEIVRE